MCAATEPLFRNQRSLFTPRLLNLLDVCCDGSTVKESEKLVQATSPEPSVEMGSNGTTAQESEKLVHATTSPETSVHVCCDGTNAPIVQCARRVQCVLFLLKEMPVFNVIIFFVITYFVITF